jgi:hypothetical protein
VNGGCRGGGVGFLFLLVVVFVVAGAVLLGLFVVDVEELMCALLLGKNHLRSKKCDLI